MPIMSCGVGGIGGKILENIIVTEELHILNDGSPTHISGTSVDITIASPNVAPDLQWAVLPSVLSSYHHPIVITMTAAGHLRIKMNYDVILRSVTRLDTEKAANGKRRGQKIRMRIKQ